MRYENGWFSGTIEYYNSKLREYMVSYLDDILDFHLMTLMVLKLFWNDHKEELLTITETEMCIMQ